MLTSFKIKILLMLCLIRFDVHQGSNRRTNRSLLRRPDALSSRCFQSSIYLPAHGKGVIFAFLCPFYHRRRWATISLRYITFHFLYVYPKSKQCSRPHSATLQSPGRFKQLTCFTFSRERYPPELESIIFEVEAWS